MAAYEEAGLDYRPRYTPVMRALMVSEPSTLGAIAEFAGITQPAATQTVALMIKDGLIASHAGPQDGRQKLITLTDRGRALIPALQRCWQATAAASAALEAELPFSLSEVLGRTIQALEAKPFGERIREARSELEVTSPRLAKGKKKK